MPRSFKAPLINFYEQKFRSRSFSARTLIGGFVAVSITALAAVYVHAADDKPTTKAAAKPALAVTTTSLQRNDWARRITATGNITAWQEAVIGAELAGLRLVEVSAGVGDRVTRGQVLARLQRQTQEAELAQTRAAVAEAQATLAEAQANAERARQLQPSGALSTQQINQYLTAEQTARARLTSAQARVQTDELRLTQTLITAPDDGVISSRLATLGAVVQPGQELFRLIRKNRLEWRAELPYSDLAQIKPGMPATISGVSGQKVKGTVRMVAPTVDVQSRNGLVYVDLVRSEDVRAGVFARGEFEIGRSTALTLPQSAVLQRDGFSYVLRVGANSRVSQSKVSTGRRVGDLIEVTGGLEPGIQVVASGAGFLGDGDLVRVVGQDTAQTPAVTSATKDSKKRVQ